MSDSIIQARVMQYQAMVHMLAEQRYARFMDAVTTDTMEGKSKSIERLGAPVDEANQLLTRHGDTPLNYTPHTRRWVYAADFAVADLVDRFDIAKILIDPASKYAIKQASAMARSRDSAVIRALGGTAQEGENGETAVVLPDTQKVGSNSTGLTVLKLRTAKKLLDQAEVDEHDPRFFVCSAEQMDNLLATTEVTSMDFNTVRTLVMGQIDTFLGFKFIRSERLEHNGSNRLCYGFAKSGITLATNIPVKTDVDKRPDKLNSMQVLTTGSWGAVRVEDERVVQVECQE